MICDDLEKVTKAKESRDVGKNIRKRKVVAPKPTQTIQETRRERNIDACVMNTNRDDKGRKNKKKTEHRK